MKKINWKKEARLLPGYLVVIVWVAFTAVMLFWILGASHIAILPIGYPAEGTEAPVKKRKELSEIVKWGEF